MERNTTSTVALLLTPSGAKSNYVMTQTILFPQYRFVNHFKSTTTYLPIHSPIYQHYHPLEACSPLLIHDNNIWKK